MFPKDKQGNIYDYFFDINDGKFKRWETIVDTSPIPADIEVLPSCSCPLIDFICDSMQAYIACYAASIHLGRPTTILHLCWTIFYCSSTVRAVGR
jgi:hypothetical protein